MSTSSMTMHEGDPQDPHVRNVGRGNACRTCRQSKMRCDGVRPVCGRCMAARRRSMNTMRRRGAVEQEIQAVTFLPCFEPKSEGTGQCEQSPAGQTVDSSHEHASSSSGSKRRPSAPEQGSSHKRRIHLNGTDWQMSSPTGMAATSSVPAQGETSAWSDPPSWAPEYGEISSQEISCPLPEQSTLVKLVEICYDQLRAVCIFHPGRLFERLALPPDDPQYPHPAALHALVSIGYAARPDLDQAATGEPPKVHSGAHYRHYVAADAAVRRGMRTRAGGNALDVARASLLLVYKSYGQGDHVESYICCATAMRFCIMLNLNLEIEQDPKGQLRIPMVEPYITHRSVFRGDPRDEIEAEEMRRTMLIAFLVDRTSAIATLWPTMLCEEDYTAELPRATMHEFVTTTTTNLHSQSWTRQYNASAIHDSTILLQPAVDVEQFLFKSNVLLGRCALHVSRISRRATADQITSSFQFQQLESWIASVQLEAQDVPKLLSAAGAKSGVISGQVYRSLTEVLSAKGEPSLRKLGVLIAFTFPHACTLTLHEPIANLDLESAARCAAATHEIITALRSCALHAQDVLQHMDILLTIICTLAGRSLVRQLERAYVNFISQQLNQQGQQRGTGQEADVFPQVWTGAQTIDGTHDLTDLVSRIQADLRVVLLTLKRIGEKWQCAIKLHDSLLQLLDFNPDDRYRGLFFSGLLNTQRSS